MAFQDGSSKNTTAVVAAIEPILDKASPAHNKRVAKDSGLEKMRADGDMATFFETNTPNAAFPWILSEPAIAILGAPSKVFLINEQALLFLKKPCQARAILCGPIPPTVWAHRNWMT